MLLRDRPWRFITIASMAIINRFCCSHLFVCATYTMCLSCASLCYPTPLYIKWYIYDTTCSNALYTLHIY